MTEANKVDEGSSKRKAAKAWKAPRPCSLASMLALLVIAHSDTKFKDHTGRLQIDWMVHRRDTLNVWEGYWKRIQTSNLDQVLGQDFVRCRKYIRPYLQRWASHLTLETPPSDVEEVNSFGSDVHSTASVDPVITENGNPVKTNGKGTTKTGDADQTSKYCASTSSSTPKSHTGLTSWKHDFWTSSCNRLRS
ncbi:hypothetical protein HD806DRAFT_541726 [Xylariaceae sp. AK1471]|nr:hypothetical protein HD806DRAFT_541726 [Xylariaceae sp. AK1471]